MSSPAKAVALTLALAVSLGATPALSQTAGQPGQAETDRLVARMTDFADALATPATGDELAFFSADLAARIPPTAWAAHRARVTGKTGGLKPLRGHKLTWYRDGTMLVGAFDYSSVFANDAGAICGTAIWNIPDAGAPLLRRFEENLVDATALAALSGQPTEAVAQQLTDWYCPPALITHVLGLSKP